jgi:hypothetical protein
MNRSIVICYRELFLVQRGPSQRSCKEDRAAGVLVGCRALECDAVLECSHLPSGQCESPQGIHTCLSAPAVNDTSITLQRVSEHRVGSAGGVRSSRPQRAKN